MLPAPLPADLQRRLDETAQKITAAFDRRQYAEAQRLSEDLYALLSDAQLPGQWYHKGLALHNIGAALLLQQRSEEAYRYFVLACLEDALGREPGLERLAFEKPAGLVLTALYHVPEEFLNRLGAVAGEIKREGAPVRNPQEFLVRLEPLPVVSEIILAESKLEPGQFPARWEERVFVGGSYAIVAVIEEIRNAVSATGFYPVVAFDYRTPDELIHHHSLMLLHECKYAIFDISVESGQLIELERVRDFGVETFVVYQTIDPGIERGSAMLRGLLAQQGIASVPYRDLRELRAIVGRFLAGKPR